MPRIKCSVLDRNREKVFGRIATRYWNKFKITSISFGYLSIFFNNRGVVKFFNVCNQEQRDIETKIKVVAGSSERKRDKILNSIDKGSFLDKLKENSNSEDEENKNEQVKFLKLKASRNQVTFVERPRTLVVVVYW